ncbi:mannitol dehydrogenase family protein [Crossiella equi]|uniref:mannitol dehydrogenase family protein n=1 Tax=Crossiella equi TaxID=130796 RepID=UPI001302482C|nr:mannitol dehydrogenase family protein [Crossiella equi]
MTGDLVLSARTLDRLPASVARPGPRSGEAPGIVHLGAGAFHRAHQAVHTEEAGDGWGILAVSPRNPAAAEALSTQDGYFSVTEQDGHGSRLGVVGSIVSALALPGREAELTAAVAAPSTRVVTLTITEQGYADRSVLRHLLTGLLARLDAGGEPLAIVACDNLRNADRLLPRALDELARELDPGRYRALADYLGTVGFPSSVVDRITPATSPDDLAAVAARLGVADRAAVVTEPYRMWVLTDEFPAGRPKWENAGVSFVAEVEPYEQRKLRLLNGTHSALAYLGQLGDHATIADAVADPWCAGFARALANPAHQGSATASAMVAWSPSWPR